MRALAHPPVSSWRKLGFVPATMPWDDPDANILTRIVFGAAAHQLGDAWALRMFEHLAHIGHIEDTTPNDDKAVDEIRSYLLTLQPQEATELVAFRRQARITMRGWVERRAGNRRGRFCTLGYLPFGEPLYTHPAPALPF